MFNRNNNVDLDTFKTQIGGGGEWGCGHCEMSFSNTNLALCWFSLGGGGPYTQCPISYIYHTVAYQWLVEYINRLTLGCRKTPSLVVSTALGLRPRAVTTSGIFPTTKG